MSEADATTINEIDHKALESLIRRVEEAIEHGLALDSEDLSLLLQAIQTLAFVQTEIANKSVTLQSSRRGFTVPVLSHHRTCLLSIRRFRFNF